MSETQAGAFQLDYRLMSPSASLANGQPSLLVTVTAPNVEAQRVPATIVFLIDCSASMYYSLMSPENLNAWADLAKSRGELQRVVADGREKHTVVGQTKEEMAQQDVTPMHGVRDALAAVTADILPDDDICVVGFADRGALLHHGSDPGVLRETLGHLVHKAYGPTLGGGTHMTESVNVVGQWLASLPARKSSTEIILISDGVVVDSAQATEAMSAPALQGVRIAAIGHGVEFDQNLLCYLADVTQGEYHFAQTAEQIAPAIRSTFERLQGAVVTDTWLQLKPAGEVRFPRAYRVLPEVGDAFLRPTGEDWGALQLGALGSGEQQAVLVELVGADQPSDSPVAEVALSATFHSGDSVSQSLVCQGDAAHWEAPDSGSFTAQLARAVAPYKLGHMAEEAERTGELERARDLYRQQAKCLRALGEAEEAEIAEQHAVDLETGQSHGRVPTRQLRQHTRRLTRKIKRPSDEG
jgi:Ca-activated chloride channel family protein